MRKSEYFSHHIYETFLSILSSIPVESEFFVINRESINDALIIVRLLFAKLDSRRKSCRCFDRSDTFQLIDISRATTRGGEICADRGEQTKQPFPCITYFFIRPVVHLLRENRLRDFNAAFWSGTRKISSRARHNKIIKTSWLYLSLIKLFLSIKWRHVDVLWYIMTFYFTWDEGARKIKKILRGREFRCGGRTIYGYAGRRVRGRMSRIVRVRRKRNALI